MNNLGQAIHIKKEILVRIIKAFLSDDFEHQARLIPYDMRPKENRKPYKKNERVRITIPNGDYKERKIIEGYAIQADGKSGESINRRRYDEYQEAKTIYNDSTFVEFSKNDNNCLSTKFIISLHGNFTY